MAKVNVICNGCGKRFRALEEELAGVRCPECNGELLRDTAAPATAAAAAEQPATTQPPQPPAEPAPAPATPDLSADDLQGLERLRTAHQAILGELDKAIVGQQAVIEELFMAVLAGGHCLLEGVPGLAKTLLVSSLAEALSLTFKRIQFTPDLLPSDITGTEIIQDDPETGRRAFKFFAGPIFANIILADEINRTPPKTQAAMLEAMQERQVSIGGSNHKLPFPFFVLATQNPLEQEGTYPLPEAQQDRFLFKVMVGYPSEAEEKQIIRRVTEKSFRPIQHVLSGEEIRTMQQLVTRIPVAETVIHYATSLVRATRVGQPGTPDFINQWLAWGCGPRASIALVAAGKARAALRGAKCVSCDDVAAVAHPVMRHRLAVNYSARAEGMTPESVIAQLLQATPKY
ncbi:MAG: MoxR family ATPase [Lentisphaeria bacterium]|jgi:MoxR-like ATPase